MTKSKIFFIFSISFIGGIFLTSFCYPYQINDFVSLIFLAMSIMLVAVFYKNKEVVIFGLTIIILFLAISFTNSKFSRLNNLNFSGKYFSGKFHIIKEPEIRDRMQKLIVETEAIAKTKILVNTNSYQKFNYGDELEIDCLLQVPENFDDNFDYRMYLAKDEIFYECKNAKITKTNLNNGNEFYSAIIRIKNKFNNNINSLIPAPQSGLLSGLLIGGSDQLSKNVKDDFSKTGMTHIVAVSGYNVTIVAEYLMIIGIFFGLWRRQAFWFAVSGIIIFVIFTGLSASAVRAGVMGILLIWAMKNGRLANSKNAILFSADAMLLFNPLLLFYDVGFQLSFLATVGIIYLYPICDNYLVKKNKSFGLLEIFFLTISAQIFVLPIILLNFRNLSLISPLVNLLVLPIVPITMLCGFIAVMISFISPHLALIFSWLAYILLKYETIIIGYMANLKFASIQIDFSWRGVIIWYGILMAGMYFIEKRKNKFNNEI